MTSEDRLDFLKPLLQVYRLSGRLASRNLNRQNTISWSNDLDINDDLPQNTQKQKQDLDPMSIEELNEYITELAEEIERVRAEIAKKEAHRSGVEALFKN